MEKIEIFGDFIDDEIQEVDEFDERYLDDIDYYEDNEADGVYINNTYYSYDEYENLNYYDENDYGQWNDDYIDDYDDYYDDKYYSSKYQSTASSKTIKKIDEDDKKEVKKEPLLVTDVNKITVKKLPGLTIEYKQDTRSLLNSKVEKEKKPAKVYYAVRNGRKVGVYESLEKAQKQVKGISGSEWKKFKNLEDANKYIKEDKVYKGKCYVVARGRKTGIYKNYELAREQTDGYSSAYMKKFNTLEKAKEYINQNKELSDLKYIDFINNEKILKIYTDGSYSEVTKKYGAAFVVIEDGKEIYRYSYAERDITGKKNISGELVAAMRALEWIFITKYSDNVEINHDLSLIKDICKNKINPKINYGKILKQLYNMCIKDGISVNFNEIESHSGNYWNNFADRLAKKAAKIEDKVEMLFFKNIEENKKYPHDNENIAKNIIENRQKARDKKKLLDKRIKPTCVSSQIGFLDRVKNMFNKKNKLLSNEKNK